MKEEKTIRMGDLPGTWEGLGRPKSITFCVTEDCNLACKYCYMTGKNHEKKMTFETAKKTVDYILSNREVFNEKSVIWEFIGGEPFLEIELIDKITDYIKQQTFMLDHPWFNSYRLSFSTNGILYGTPEVQNYIKKNHYHLSIGMSVDGNKIKHDLQRVKLDGSGSYDDVVKNVPLWLEQFPTSGTKATFAHADLPYLKDSVISLWNLGIRDVAANVVFEDVWEEGDDLILEQQLNELGDYILENELWEDYSVRFFDPNIGYPLEKDQLASNFCGAGKMLAIDTEGNFTPCIRFLGVSLNNRKPLIIGNADVGINTDKIRPFLALNVTSQSLHECVTCDVASGCAWCQGCNYDLADTDTIYQRATYICKMHKATVRANKYFWDKFEKVTGIESRRKSIKQEGDKFLQFITSDQITPHCSYKNTKESEAVMSQEIFQKGLKFCKDNHMIPVMLGKIQQEDKNNSASYVKFDKAGEKHNHVSIYRYQVDEIDAVNIANLIISKQELDELSTMVEKLLENEKRVNLVIDDLCDWKQEDLDKYKQQLELISEIIFNMIQAKKKPVFNVLTDLWVHVEMYNCDAGIQTFALAPNGKIYICPGFYFENPENAVGSLDTGIHVKNQQLLKLENAPICSACDVYSCDRCVFQNMKTTNEVNTPSKNQCLSRHIQRTVSMKLQKRLLDSGEYSFRKIIHEIDYQDPLEKIIKES